MKMKQLPMVLKTLETFWKKSIVRFRIQAIEENFKRGDTSKKLTRPDKNQDLIDNLKKLKVLRSKLSNIVKDLEDLNTLND